MQNMLGDNIRNLRIRRKITQEQLAEVLDVSPQAVSRWENNSTSPDISLIPVIAGFFDVTCDYLLGAGITRREKQMEEALAAYQNNLIVFSAALQMSFEQIRKLGDYTVRQKIEMTETMEKFVLLLMGEEPGLFGDRLYRIARYLMRRYAEIGEHDKALEYLMKCFRYVHSYEECPESAKSSLPWLSEVKADRESMVKHSTQTLYEDLTEYMAKYKLNEYFSGEECQILFSFNEQNDPREEMPGADG